MSEADISVMSRDNLALSLISDGTED